MQWRHGDVQVVKVKQLPVNCKRLDRRELAYGEVTGHAHRIDIGELFESTNGELFLNVSKITNVTHEELGWDEYMKRIDTYLVHKWFDPTQMLHYELYDFKERRFELMPRFLKMESPELKDGSRPYYIDPVDPKLETCQAARTRQFRKLDGRWPTVEEANKNPILEFIQEA